MTEAIGRIGVVLTAVLRDGPPERVVEQEHSSLWFVFAGIWLGIGHVVTAAGCFATIIGIPFGIQHLKLAALAFAPIGKTIVDA